MSLKFIQVLTKLLLLVLIITQLPNLRVQSLELNKANSSTFLQDNFGYDMGDWKQNASIVAVTAAVVAATVFTGGLATTLVAGAIGAGAVATGVGLTTAFLVGNVLSYLGGSVMNGKLLDPKEFACGNKEADAIECVSYQGGQLLTGAILTEGIGLVIPKGATTKVSGVTQGIDDLKKMVNYVDEVDEFGKVKVTDIDPDTGLKRFPCVSSLDNQNKSLLDYALVIIGVRGLSVEAANCVYQGADYHTQEGNALKSPAPKNGQLSLNNSIQIKSTSPRRIAMQSDNEFVIFDQTSEGVYHGHVRPWEQLTPEMKSVLKKAGLVKSNRN
jgi:filamentous hemagglutinin